jgi:hypothetical protein
MLATVGTTLVQFNRSAQTCSTFDAQEKLLSNKWIGIDDNALETKWLS